MNPTFMILPSLSCQASCSYCFGPHRGAMMDERTAEAAVRFVGRASGECGMTEINVVFHGGEPLLAPVGVWRVLLEGLDGLDLPVRMSLQSNLWALDDEKLALLQRHRVRLGTSLDGPRDLCDMNRGASYFDHTTAGLEKAEAAGERVGAIATLTRQTLPHAREILAFFRDRNIDPVLHCAIRGMDAPEDPWSLTADQFAEGIIDLFPWYIKNRKHLRVVTLDHFCRGAAHGDAGVCTMADCLGLFLAVSPTGDITSCQRFAGKPEYSLGNVFDEPAVAELFQSPAAGRLLERQRRVVERCRECPYLNICRGGCYYNAIVSGDGVIDPLCDAYKRIYGFLEERLNEEAVSPENIAALRASPARPGQNPLLRSGDYISIADDVHPSLIAENARRALAAHALGKYPDVNEAARSLCGEGVCGDFGDTVRALEVMKAGMERAHSNLNNCYLHVTARCNLRCAHCYASAGDSEDEMPVEVLERLGEEALALKFRQLVITGGEPLFHRDREGLVAACKRLRGRGSNLVLRTNLTGAFTDEDLLALADAFDQVVVSVDGSEQTHDHRRGPGAYAGVVANCERYAALTAGRTRAGELSLACVMDAESINGEPGRSVRELGERLDVPRVRFRPLLPLGRAAGMDEPVICEGISQHEAPLDKLRSPFRPLTTCGIGQNVYICPDGAAYPCYAWKTEASYLGNVAAEGLAPVLAGGRFTRLRACTVNTIEKCRDCEYRYLCGGACRAWGNQQETDPNTAPPACDHLQRNARALIDAAKAFLLS